MTATLPRRTTPLAELRDAPPYFLRAAEAAGPLVPGKLYVTLPSGDCVLLSNGRPGPVSEIVVHDPEVFRTLFRDGWLAFAEAYLEGGWSSPDLQAFQDHTYAIDFDLYDTHFAGAALVRAFEKLRFWLQSNTKRQARRNIAYHYDLGNEFYRLWLDDTMTYSSALFRTGQESLEKAQTAKYDSMIDRMGARPGDHVLEIGCGWGGFAEHAAGQRGLRVTGVTISRAQLDYAQARIARAGLSDRVDLRLQDYRDVQGTFDGIASIEMFEAVGERYWPTYFRTVRERLKPGANATLQIITVDHGRWDAYRKGVDFIQKYIFPGGMLPSPVVLRDEVRRAGLDVAGSVEFGESYSQTLRRWHDTFNEKWDEVSRLGFDETFRRMWNFYLTSCAATFASGNCDVTQITVTRPS
ncbi:SAM-dependent methyltransferase [Roseivivax isoporae]|uniref:Cyclopropane-fatty-acyl-phospholipid synthase n=1 Tax=Roseivivax isoporae LMG 25204 TaxID=1449351 RepID=X7FCU1_9RHOB|nr:cyclopropane-fatty-acyl-phospholipid synthase family protein [Roseivivax isoporae]ETX30727.1 cyclopropane-fatty-acyl-phospholipid synthase [Roseivivax isoporae LMG 25204]